MKTKSQFTRGDSVRKYLIASAVVLACSATLLQAETAWIGGNGNFNAGSNWSTGIVPGETDIAVFDHRAAVTSYTLSFGGEDAATEGARFLASSGTIGFTIGNGVTWSVSDLFQVGNGAGANPVVQLLTGEMTVGTLTVHPGARFQMRGDSVPAAGPVLTVENGSNIASSDLLIADFERAFTWRMTGGDHQYTGAGPVSIADGARSQADVIVTGPETTWNSGGGALNIGQRGLGHLSILDGAVVSTNAAYLGREHAASAGSSAAVSGAGSRWNLSGTLRVGQAFPDTSLVISDGAAVNGVDARIGEGVAASGNEVLVTGPGSSWQLSSHLTLGGAGGQNSLRIADGGTVQSAGFVRLGREASTSHENLVVIEDPGSRWTFVGTPPDDSFTVGHRGKDNQLLIRNGGELSVTGSSLLGALAESAGNIATVTDEGSLWSTSALLIVGNGGANNLLSIDDGGAVVARDLWVGSTAGSIGNRIEINGGRLVVDNELHVGLNGEGSVLFNGGRMEVARLYVEHEGRSTFDFSGGRLETGRAVITHGEPLTIGDGEQCAVWYIGADSHTVAGGVVVSTSGILAGAGTLTADVVNSGRIMPGHSLGALTIDGDLILESFSDLVLEIAGSGETEYDRLIVTGDTVIDGILTVRLVEGYQPTGEVSFQFLNLASQIGEFSMVDLPELPAGLFWNATELYSAGKLIIESDGETGGFDAWRAHWFPDDLGNEQISGPGANPAGDGVINLMKYALGLSPEVASRDSLPTGAIQNLLVEGSEGRYLTLTFTRPGNITDIVYTVEASSDLVDWASTPVEALVEEHSDGTVTLVYRDAAPVGETARRFLRLSVRLN